MNFSKKILLVEDSPFQRTICVSQLKQVGFENIEVADDGNVGYSMLEEGDFDLVLCDWEMPELNGIQLLKKVKKNAALQHIPFLMLTSIDDHERLQEAIEAGGGKGSRGFFNRKEDFYRGGPVEQELYDRISYDDLLSISYQAPEFRFEYEGGWLRVFHTDGRRRSTTANDFYSEGGDDFSFANFDSEAIIVEARPRDGGFTLETYTLINNGSQLRVEMVLEPDSFREAIELVLIYDRVDGSSNDSNN